MIDYREAVALADTLADLVKADGERFVGRSNAANYAVGYLKGLVAALIEDGNVEIIRARIEALRERV